MIRYAIIFLSLLGLSACETTKGFGQDVESLGQNIEQEAEAAS